MVPPTAAAWRTGTRRTQVRGLLLGQATSFLKVSSTAGPLKGFTIQPLTPAALPRSFMLGLLSVVSMIRFTVLFFSSLRIFSTMVRPSMFGMLTSATTSLMPGSALSFTSPSLPSTAVTTSSPLLFRKVDTSSRTVLESSTTSIFAMTVFPAVLEQFQLAAGLLDRGKSRDIDRGGTAHAQRDVHFH